MLQGDAMNKEWNPELYLRFNKERTQPAIDLLNRIEIALFLIAVKG